MVDSVAQLIAASGMTAITHSNRTPAADAIALMQHLASRGFRLAIRATSDMHRWRWRRWSTPRGVRTIRLLATQWDEPLYLVRSGDDETPGLNAARNDLLVSAV